MSKDKFVFGSSNIKIIVGGFSLSLLGFVLMIGGGSADPNEFNEAELFSFTRITVAPLLVMVGYGIVIWGIMKKNKANK